MIKNLIFLSTFIYLTIAWSSARLKIAKENEHAFKAWVADHKVHAQAIHPGVIYIVKNDALCEAIDCEKNYSIDDWKVVMIGQAPKFTPDQTEGAFEVLKFNALSPNKIDITYSAVDSDHAHHFICHLPKIGNKVLVEEEE